ncbi:MAG: hydroxymethylglutaryl-CoA reductase, degradative [Candidatus Thermoplasmatota archaeon]|nr:hydroxymethylglutaryl-CoA reductase, degradative [Candidatus Thermoplasmatota archaeon]
MQSVIPKFYNLSIAERLKILKKFAGLSNNDLKILHSSNAFINRMIENVVGTFPLPLGIATNFLINGKDYLIPMAIEETSVVAACSHGAKIARIKGGFEATSTEPVMIGQIQIVDLKNIKKAQKNVLREKEKILELANEKDPILVKLGGGAKDIELREIITSSEKMLAVHLLVSVKDAMGANVVNTMCEAVAPFIEKITGGKVILRIISNLAVYRIARAKAVFDCKVVGGEEIVNGIIKAWEFACNDIYRCATHNKGIMNGIDAVAIATGNDFRALEAGAHAYAASNGYKPLTKYEKSESGDLIGTIELPIAVGIVGGATIHPTAKICKKILGIKSANELAEVLASVGLAQNFAALRALVKEGIQRGHMSLHAHNIAVMAGAKRKEIDKVVEILVKEKEIRVDRAKEIIEEIRKKDKK